MKIKIKDVTKSYKQRMMAIGINQNELAEVIGVSVTTMSNILKGISGNFAKMRLIEQNLELMENQKKNTYTETYKQKLVRLGITQSFIAEKLGVTKQEISRKINNKRTESSNWPELEKILKEFEENERN